MGTVPADGRPSFAVDFPRRPELDRVVEAFVQGNYARVRSEAARILASETDEGVRRAARTLIARTEPAPLAVLLLGLAALLFAVVAGWWTVRKPPPIGPRPHAQPPPHAQPARPPTPAR
jgi:hypothetical protein